MRRGLMVLLALTLVMGVAMSQPAQGLAWTQTSTVDFQAGRWSNIEVLPTGDLQLAATPAWSKTGMVLDVTPGSYDSESAMNQFVMKDGTTYRMWYRGSDGSRIRILYATSTDGVSWTKRGIAINVLVAPYFFDSVSGQAVMKEGSTYKMWFGGGFWVGPFGLSGRIYYATSTDAVSWTIAGVALDMGPTGSWDAGIAGFPTVTKDAGGTYWMYYSGWDGTTTRLGVATSTDGVTFTKSTANPVVGRGPLGSWEDKGLNMPFVETAPPRILWYSASGTKNRAGYATSTDGVVWTKAAENPVLKEGPAGSWDNGGAYAPSLLSDGAAEWMYYTGSDGTANRIGRARQVPDYTSSGWYESAVLDTGSWGSVWNSLSANATVAAQTQLSLRTRTGDVPAPDASWSPWSAPVPPGTSPIASPRARYLQVRADFATSNSTLTPVLHEFTVAYEHNSASPPTPFSPVGGAWVNTSGLRVQWVYSDPESDPQTGFRVQISDRSDFSTINVDSNDVLSADTFWRSPPLADGAWFWRVRTLDSFGAWGPYSAPANVRIDTVPPITLLDFAVTPGFVNGVPQLDSSNRVRLSAFDVGSGGTTTKYSVDLGPLTTYTGPFLPSDHGPIALTYWSVDAAGNSETPNLAALLLDDAPAVTLVAPASGTWTNSSRLALDWAYADPESDPASVYEVQLSTDPSFATVAYSSGQVPGTATSHTFPGVADGTYYWRVRAADSFGAWSAFSTARTVSVDTGLPTLTYAFSATLGTVDGRTWIAAGTTLTLTATDVGSGIAGIYYSIDGGAAVLYAGPVPLSSHGTHTALCWAVDEAGNAGPRARADFLIDRAPSATNSEPSEQAWATAPPRLGWSFADPDSDPAAGYEVQVASDASFSTATASSGTVDSTVSAWQAPALPDGDHYWRVRVRDDLNVWSGWSSPTRLRIDTTPPQANALHGGSVIPASTGVFALFVDDAIELNATDATSGLARIEFSLDGGSWTDYSGPIRFDTEGRHTLLFRATDNAGNTAPTRALVVDATYPFNWTPVVAVVLAVVLALVGAVLASRRKDPNARPSKGLAWAIMAGPGTILEVIVGVYSLVTGELAMPPWLDAGLVAVLAVAVVGFVSIAIGWKALAAQTPAAEAEEPAQEPEG